MREASRRIPATVTPSAQMQVRQSRPACSRCSLSTLMRAHSQPTSSDVERHQPKFRRKNVTQRVNILAKKNESIDGLAAVETWIAKSFDPKLLELVKVRVSQMNGCAHCLHMHWHDAMKL